ncbi:MAG: dimethyl sulfoxide reductase anchor subunit [Eggerthellaceae bacterium]|nr:dimethyl sulfoxide reductase anchor subunit [Eggerthellaceae bacterium]
MEVQWPLVIFTTFICLSTGTFGILNFLKPCEKTARIQYPAMITTCAALIIGGIASVLHLQTPTNYFGQFGNLSSGVNHELIGIVLVFIMLVIYFVLWYRNKHVNIVIRIISVIVCFLLVYLMADSYLLASKPAWDTALLPLYYLVNAAALGSITMLVISAICHMDSYMTKRLAVISLIFVALFALVVIGYTIYLSIISESAYTGPIHLDATTTPPIDPAETGARLLTGDLAVLYWVGVIGIELCVPIICLIIAWLREKTRFGLGLAAGICVIAGGICFRMILYYVAATVFLF